MDKELIQHVRGRATDRCEYCHLPERVSELKHVMDHIVARQHGGRDDLENLALCCVRCNQHKGPNVAGVDPDTTTMTRLYNPRADRWSDHFEYDGPVVMAKTNVGRATIMVLAINHPLRIAARRGLLAEGITLG